jgi:D-3-phosphoglycerate dehydrogenase
VNQHQATVAITDCSFPTLEIEQQILAPLGCRILAGQCRTSEEVANLIESADAVICQFAPIDRAAIAAAAKAKVIVRYGIGVDNVDLEAARSRSIPVCNVPDYCIDEVADHTLAFILALTRQVVANCQHIRTGQWGLATPLAHMLALAELCVGVVGFGRIGRAVTQRLGPFRCRRLVHDPAIPAAQIEQAGCRAVSLEELLETSDIVTLHCPSTQATRGIINGDAFKRMRPGALLVNLARGDLVETAELTKALESGRLAGCALDVCNPEPIPADSPLRSMPNVIASAHVASASSRAVRQLRQAAAETVARALQNEPLQNIVNGVIQCG